MHLKEKIIHKSSLFFQASRRNFINDATRCSASHNNYQCLSSTTKKVQRNGVLDLYTADAILAQNNILTQQIEVLT